MNSIADVIDEIAARVTIVRSTPPEVYKGRVQGAPQERRIDIRASVQPMPTRDLLFLPEGLRNQGMVKVFTRELLLTVDTSTHGIPDRFTFHNVEYEVTKVDDWADVAGYYRVFATRVTR